MGGWSTTRSKAARRRRFAVAASLLIHAGLVCGLLRIHGAAIAPRGAIAPNPDTVEVLFEVTEPKATSPEPMATADTMVVQPSLGARSPGRAPRAPIGVRSPGRNSTAPSSGGRAADGATATTASPTGEESVPSPESTGWGTFQPAHPDLHGGLGASASEGNRRDLLAAPTAKSAPGPARDLPGVLHGGGGVSARVAEDGRIQFRDPKDISNVHIAGVGIAGDLDVTDQVMKLAGQRPYTAVKHKMAEETREARLCMARRAQGERQKQELLNLSSEVRKVAARLDISAAERRKLVFDIWDECLEESGSSDYGAMARATIVAIIREVFPEGSTLAYGPAELVAMNERRSSRQAFNPYRPELPSRPRHPDAGAE
jgi:hypothetical protein